MSSRIKTDVKKLFEFWCEVALVHNGEKHSTPTGGSQTSPSCVIVESFPEGYRDEKTMADIPSFAFPCKIESDSVQSYSFVLTTDDSKWRFGFCRHDPKTDTAMVIITYLPWHDTFLRLLTLLAELRRCDETTTTSINNANDDFRTFLAEAYNRGVPDPGGHLKLFYNGGQNYFVFERPLTFQLPSIPENHNLNLYYNFVDPKNMIAVFAAMLAERRIIFTSRRLDRLSSCIQAANAFLYPMVWQHIFIPVLPMKLKDYLSAPMPYLIGVPQTVLETMTTDELGEVVILNCDTKVFQSPFDDVREMPADIVSQMKKQLSHSNEHIGDRVSKIFLGVLVQLISGYRDAVEFRETSKTFNRDKFIESRPKHLRPFLAKMMELQIFQQFIDERLQMLNTGLGYSDEFELETARYAEKMKKRRHYEFLNNVKEKSLRSLQPQHLPVPEYSLKSAAASSTSSQEDTMNDLISLDDSNNTSFDLEDFDPLNQNARPLPLRNGNVTVKNAKTNGLKSTTLPANTNTKTNILGHTSANTVSNPLYPYHTPQHLRSPHMRAQPQTRALTSAQLKAPTMKPPPLPTSKPPPMPAPDEDFELLRKYGLDQFTLTTAPHTLTTTATTTAANVNGSSSNGGANTAALAGGGMHNWTTFD
ncbi:DENN domain-containing protein 1A isoform X5 [Bactrocera oleae]|uniref:DENN domain-containing protein 1A isoform X5 n=1 Tax=Bactrocera oleae TaxID=104688 RepID=UPI0006B74EA3|nr:DENN domain-containing protein 1A isoform X5 [Bactrocera oleae]